MLKNKLPLSFLKQKQLQKLSDFSLIELLQYHKFILAYVSHNTLDVIQSNDLTSSIISYKNIECMNDIILPKLPLILFEKEGKDSDFFLEDIERRIIIDCTVQMAELTTAYIKFAKVGLFNLRNAISHVIDSKIIKENKNQAMKTFNFINENIINLDHDNGCEGCEDE